MLAVWALGVEAHSDNTASDVDEFETVVDVVEVGANRVEGWLLSSFNQVADRSEPQPNQQLERQA